MNTQSEITNLIDEAIVFGRDDEWNTLLSSKEPDTRKVVYVWGSAGSGKTHLVQRFFDELQGQEFQGIWSPARLVAKNEGQFLLHLSSFLNISGDLNISREKIAHELIQHGTACPLLWVIDDYDCINVERDWLWTLWQQLIALGACIVLSGRESPLRLWPGDQYAQSQVQSVALSDFTPEISSGLLAMLGINEPSVIEHAIMISRGRPKLLCAIADGIKLAETSGAPADDNGFQFPDLDLSGFLIEQICHPGSKRLSWRAGQGDDEVDTLIAASSLVSICNRDLMAHVVGFDIVHEGWDQFVSLPVIDSYRGGYYGLSKELRNQVAATARRARPWAWEQWTRNASQHYLKQARSGKIRIERIWPLVRGFIRPYLNEPLLELTSWENRSWTVIWRSSEPDHNAQTLVMVIKDGQNNDIATVHCLAENAHTLTILDAEWNYANSSMLQLVVANVAEMFHRFQRVLWRVPQPCSELNRLVDSLAFVKYTENEALNEWELDLSNTNYIEWIAKVLKPPYGSVPDDSVRVTQLVLQSLHDEGEFSRTEASQYWHSVAKRGSFRSWFLDALNSADLGPTLGGKTLLALYYLDRQGTHEELAEVLHVSRATYFRNHRAALEHLAAAVFS